jgi:hypothetical protein
MQEEVAKSVPAEENLEVEMSVKGGHGQRQFSLSLLSVADRIPWRLRMTRTAVTLAEMPGQLLVRQGAEQGQILGLPAVLGPAIGRRVAATFLPGPHPPPHEVARLLLGEGLFLQET